MPRAGLEFEELVSDTYKYLYADRMDLRLNDRILGKKSGRSRQIDLSIRDSERLLIVDAKDHKRPVGISAVDQLVGVAGDVEAYASAIVAASGFTQGAKCRAAYESIDLLTIIDPTGEHKWQTDFSAECLCLITMAGDVRLKFTDSSEFFERNPHQNPLCLKLYDHQYNLLGPVHDWIFFETILPLTDIGLFDYPLVAHRVLVADRSSPGGFREIMLTATLQVRTEAWLGTTPLLQGRGLFNEINKQATLSVLDSTYDAVDVSRLRQNKNWERVWLSADILRFKVAMRYTGIRAELCPPHECA